MKNLERIFGPSVPTFFVAEGGVSPSQVARIQAENKQRNDEFSAKVTNATAGIHKKAYTFIGPGGSLPQIVEPETITVETLREYAGVAERNAQTATLMHGLKMYNRLRDELENISLTSFVTKTMPVAPPQPTREPEPKLPPAPEKPAPAAIGTVCSTKVFMDLSNIDEMHANLKPEVQFPFEFWKRANELNSRAAAIGKLLSEQGSFFRKLVDALPRDSEQMVQTGMIVTSWRATYSQESVAVFIQFRDELQAEYTDLQKQLNGCKKQIKDAVRAYNLTEERRYQAEYGIYQIAAAKHAAEVEQIRAERESKWLAMIAEYNAAREAYAREVERMRSEAETLRQQAQQELATLRVRTD